MTIMQRFLTIASLIFLSLTVRAASLDGVLAFANKQDVYMFVGKYDPLRGWMQPDSFYEPPQPADVVSVYGVEGLLGQPKITSPFRPAPFRTPRDWEATVSPWKWQFQNQALVITGPHPDLERKPVAVPLDNPQAVSAVRTYLKSKGLNVEEPQLTQVFDVDIEGNGHPERFICAHSNDDAVKPNEEAAVYAVALQVQTPPQVFASQTWFKPASRTQRQQEHLHGTRDYLRFLTFLDLNGDGRLEVVIYDAQKDATQIDVHSLQGRHWHKVLTSFKTLIY